MFIWCLEVYRTGLDPTLKYFPNKFACAITYSVLISPCFALDPYEKQ